MERYIILPIFQIRNQYGGHNQQPQPQAQVYAPPSILPPSVHGHSAPPPPIASSTNNLFTNVPNSKNSHSNVCDNNTQVWSPNQAPAPNSTVAPQATTGLSGGSGGLPLQPPVSFSNHVRSASPSSDSRLKILEPIAKTVRKKKAPGKATGVAPTKTKTNKKKQEEDENRLQVLCNN